MFGTFLSDTKDIFLGSCTTIGGGLLFHQHPPCSVTDTMSQHLLTDDDNTDTDDGDDDNNNDDIKSYKNEQLAQI